MCEEKNNNKQRRAFSCCNFDGIAEMMKGCFPDDAGYSSCLIRMNQMQDKNCCPKSDDAATEDKQGCCG